MDPGAVAMECLGFALPFNRDDSLWRCGDTSFSPRGAKQGVNLVLRGAAGTGTPACLATAGFSVNLHLPAPSWAPPSDRSDRLHPHDQILTLKMPIGQQPAQLRRRGTRCCNWSLDHRTRVIA